MIALSRRAFDDHPYSSQNEHLLVADLRNQKALSVAFVAELDEKVVGHIAFSKVTIDGEHCGWYGLAPVSVDPKYQNRGIGSQLIEKGLEALKEKDAQGCVLVGEPEYYTRFGFRKMEELTYEGVPKEFFLALSFIDSMPSGNVQYHEVFQTYS